MFWHKPERLRDHLFSYLELLIRVQTPILNLTFCMPDESKYNESLLLEDLRNGSAIAFENIFNLYWENLYRTAKCKLRAHEDAEGVVQNIFSSLWEKRETLIINNLTGYLNTALRNRILNIIRDRMPQQKYWDYYKAFVPRSLDVTDQHVAFHDLSSAVERAVNHLPEKSRQVFRLSRLEGRSNAEIANLLSVSEKAIEYHLTKSLKEMRVRLKDYITVLVNLLLIGHL